MTFVEAVRSVLSKYATFSGRAVRSEYWWWALFVFLLTLGTGVVDQTVLAPALGYEPFDQRTPEPLTWIVSLALLLPGLAVSVRRLHDTDRSGWWLLLAFIPIVGWLVLLWWFIQRGSDGPNRFGAGAPHDAAL